MNLKHICSLIQAETLLSIKKSSPKYLDLYIYCTMYNIIVLKQIRLPGSRLSLLFC